MLIIIKNTADIRDLKKMKSAEEYIKLIYARFSLLCSNTVILVYFMDKVVGPSQQILLNTTVRINK